ncbi:MAG: spore coat U domain-containing protein [Pseudomonadota bacterium]
MRFKIQTSADVTIHLIGLRLLFVKDDVMKLNKLVLALGLCATAFSASAQTVNANMAVSATIAGSCSLIANPLAFSVYDPLAAVDLDVQSTVVLTCSTGAGASLAMGIGANSTGTGVTAQRRMRVGATTNYLNYSIFQPSATTASAACAYTTAWGNGTTGGASLAIGVAASPTARTYNVCGRIPTGQSSSIGTYNDTVVVTVTL